MKNASHFYLSANFLRLAHEAATEIVKSGNPVAINTSDSQLSTREYSQTIRWTDHSVGIAALFCFYHGMELVMKGFILEKVAEAKGHKLTELLTKFESYYPDSLLCKELHKNISIIDENTPLPKFLSSNKIGIDSWYEALKYPEMKNGINIEHFPLKYNGKLGVSYWRNIANSCSFINNHVNSLTV